MVEGYIRICEWREKVAATAVVELYVNLAPFTALKQAHVFPNTSLHAATTTIRVH